MPSVQISGYTCPQSRCLATHDLSPDVWLHMTSVQISSYTCPQSRCLATHALSPDVWLQMPSVQMSGYTCPQSRCLATHALSPDVWLHMPSVPLLRQHEAPHSICSTNCRCVISSLGGIPLYLTLEGRW